MHIDPRGATVRGRSDRFTGDVWVDTIARPQPPGYATVALVRFAPGARTARHVHRHGQTLHITQGTAVVHTRDGRTIIAGPGQSVHTPPGEWHWHGAADDSFMEHLAVSTLAPSEKDSAVEWAEHITAEEYASALTHNERPSNP